MMLNRIRKSIEGDSEKYSILLAINSQIPKSEALMGDLYAKYKD